jgi:hypothetical protein
MAFQSRDRRDPAADVRDALGQLKVEIALLRLLLGGPPLGDVTSGHDGADDAPIGIVDGPEVVAPNPGIAGTGQTTADSIRPQCGRITRARCAPVTANESLRPARAG